MNHYFWIKWTDAKRCEHVVGVLYYIKNTYYFRYNKEFQNPKSIPKEFNGIPSFGQLLGLCNCRLRKRVLCVHSSNELFPFFKMRIPSKSDEYIWKSYGISKYDELKLLSLSQAIIPTDSFFVEEMDQNAIKDVAKLYLRG